MKSVFSQTVPVHEVLLVDDGSTDETQNDVASLIERHPEWRGRLIYSYRANQGKSAALNNALSRARGEWIAFDDSDDRWLPEKLEWQFRALEQYPECRACFTDSSLSNDGATSLQGAGVVYHGIIGKEDEPPGRLHPLLSVLPGHIHADHPRPTGCDARVWRLPSRATGRAGGLFLVTDCLGATRDVRVAEHVQFRRSI